MSNRFTGPQATLESRQKNQIWIILWMMLNVGITAGFAFVVYIVGIFLNGFLSGSSYVGDLIALLLGVTVFVYLNYLFYKVYKNFFIATRVLCGLYGLLGIYSLFILFSEMANGNMEFTRKILSFILVYIEFGFMWYLYRRLEFPSKEVTR